MCPQRWPCRPCPAPSQPPSRCSTPPSAAAHRHRHRHRHRHPRRRYCCWRRCSGRLSPRTRASSPPSCPATARAPPRREWRTCAPRRPARGTRRGCRRRAPRRCHGQLSRCVPELVDERAPGAGAAAAATAGGAARPAHPARRARAGAGDPPRRAARGRASARSTSDAALAPSGASKPRTKAPSSAAVALCARALSPSSAVAPIITDTPGAVGAGASERPRRAGELRAVDGRAEARVAGRGEQQRGGRQAAEARRRGAAAASQHAGVCELRVARRLRHPVRRGRRCGERHAKEHGVAAVGGAQTSQRALPRDFHLDEGDARRRSRRRRQTAPPNLASSSVNLTGSEASFRTFAHFWMVSRRSGDIGR